MDVLLPSGLLPVIHADGVCYVEGWTSPKLTAYSLSIADGVHYVDGWASLKLTVYFLSVEAFS